MCCESGKLMCSESGKLMCFVPGKFQFSSSSHRVYSSYSNVNLSRGSSDPWRNVHRTN